MVRKLAEDVGFVLRYNLRQFIMPLRKHSSSAEVGRIQINCSGDFPLSSDVVMLASSISFKRNPSVDGLDLL